MIANSSANTTRSSSSETILVSSLISPGDVTYLLPLICPDTTNDTSWERAMTDTILFNGRITTLDPANPTAAEAAIEDGLFAAAGDEREIMARRTPETVVIDLRGRTVIPGLNDSHTHVICSGLSYNMEPIITELGFLLVAWYDLVDRYSNMIGE
jgi:Amidohydrolase family